jgi:peptidoglycan/xylan/chitin deacetylase (PgdA/CDA1 family)
MLDRFWWPHIEEPETSGAEIDRAAPAAFARMRLFFQNEVRPSWLGAEPVEVILPVTGLEEVRGDVLVEAESDHGKIALVVRRGRSIVFGFDPHATLRRLLFVRAFNSRRPLRTFLPFDYQRIHPTGRLLLARALRFAEGASRRPPGSPMWPIDPSAEIVRWLWYRVRSLGGREEPPVPFWPGGKRYVITLTHDVDTAAGQQNIPRLAEVEEAEGFRSCWYMVGRRYLLDGHILDTLTRAGHEIGLHGDTHDNTLAFVPAAEIRRRLQSCGRVVERFSMQGFRSPSFFRTRALLDEVAERFAYDSSIPDTMLFPASGGGCRSVFPFSIGRLLVIPATVPPDGSLLISGFDPTAIVNLWRRKIDWIRAVGGVAVVLTHPEPQMSAREAMIEAYRSLLRQLRGDRDAWVALPHEIASHWRQRAQGLRWSPASIN